MQRGQLTEEAKTAVFAAVPGLVARINEAMDETNAQAMRSNDESSDRFYDHMQQSQAFWAARAADPDASEEERRDARDRFERVDERVANHDTDNKRFTLELARYKKELLSVIGVVVLGAAGALTKPEVRRAILGR